MSEFDVLSAASAGMDAQRAALDVAARNVASAEASGGRGGFERLVPRFALSAAGARDGSGIEGYEPPNEPSDDSDGAAAAEILPVRYLGTTAERGVDVDAVTEMVAVLGAQRAYEANASVFDIGKRLAERTIEMGRLE